jgi:hypothetical protein
METIAKGYIVSNMLNIYHNNIRDQINPNRIPIANLNNIRSVYYLNGESDHNYLFPDDDDFSSSVLIDIVTHFGSPGNENFIALQKKDQIKSKKIKNTDTIIEETCSICLDQFKCNEYCKKLPCDHSFHRKCINHWFKKDHLNCPICRYKI